MSNIIETVLIKGGKAGPVRVNKSDFDRDQESDKPTMTLHKAKADNAANDEPVDTIENTGHVADNVLTPVTDTAPDTGQEETLRQPPATVTPGQKLVTKKGKKFIIVDGEGNPVTAAGIEADGYTTEADAWAAVVAVPHGA